MTQSAGTTIPPNYHKALGLSHSRMKWWAIYIPVYQEVSHSDLPHPQSGDSQSQEMLLVSSSDKQTCNYDPDCSIHHLSQSPKGTGIQPWQDEMVSFVYPNLPRNVIIRLPHPQIGVHQGQEILLAPSAGKQTCNYVPECSNHYPSQSQ